MNNRDENLRQQNKNSASNMTSDEKEAWTEGIIRNYAYGSLVIGLVPMPLIDLVALTGLQMKLIHKLSTFYGVPFSEERGKKIIASLFGASVPLGLTRGVCSILKIVPIIGFTVSLLSTSVLSAASTYAIGKLFVRHFESGGTFLNFDVTKSRDYYEEQFKKGKTIAEGFKPPAKE